MLRIVNIMFSVRIMFSVHIMFSVRIVFSVRIMFGVHIFLDGAMNLAQNLKVSIFQSPRKQPRIAKVLDCNLPITFKAKVEEIEHLRNHWGCRL